MQGEAWESRAAVTRGGGGKWGREGLGFEGPSPLRAAGLGLGRDCKFSPSPPPSRRCGCNKRSPRLLPPPCPEGAAVRGGQHPSFLAPTPRRYLWLLGAPAG